MAYEKVTNGLGNCSARLFKFIRCESVSELAALCLSLTDWLVWASPSLGKYELRNRVQILPGMSEADEQSF